MVEDIKIKKLWNEAHDRMLMDSSGENVRIYAQLTERLQNEKVCQIEMEFYNFLDPLERFDALVKVREAGIKVYKVWADNIPLEDVRPGSCIEVNGAILWKNVQGCRTQAVKNE
jgi:hypothetical protein